MIVGIHQPNFIPWSGYFYKMAKSDLFIYLDDVQYTKNSYQNRVKIKTSQGDNWLTLPIVHKYGQLTNEVRLNTSDKWQEKHIKTIEFNYKKSINFKPVFAILSESYYAQDWKFMSDFNIFLIEKLCNYIGIGTKTIKSSELNVSGTSTERLVNLIKATGCTEYLSGFGAANYQDVQMFKDYGIELKYSEFIHPKYEQLWGEFTAGLSIIDMLFNCDPRMINDFFIPHEIAN